MQGKTRGKYNVTALSTAGGTDLLPENHGRRSLYISVSSAEAVRVTTNGEAPSATSGILIEAGGYRRWGYADGVPIGPVKVWSSGGTAVVDVEELLPFV